MKRLENHRKLRQLKAKIKLFKRLSKFENIDLFYFNNLKDKIKSLLLELSVSIQKFKLKKVALAFGFVLSTINYNKIFAQKFESHIQNPYGTQEKDFFVDLASNLIQS